MVPTNALFGALVDGSIHTEPVFAGFIVVQLPRIDNVGVDNRHTTDHF